MIYLRTLVLLALLCPGPFLLANPGPYGNWLAYMQEVRFSRDWSWWAEVQHRNYNALGDTEQLLLRGAVQYTLPAGVAFSQGYAYIVDQPYTAKGKQVLREHRPYQQIHFRQRYGRVHLQHRYRLETRFREDDLRFRFRYFLQGLVALNQREMQEGTLYLSAYDELFIHGDQPRFDRNRLYLGIGYMFSPHLRLELANLVQMKEWEDRHQFQISVLHRLDLTTAGRDNR